MTLSAIQTSSIAGELSPSILGRVDKAQFKNGASTMRNAFVRYQGGAYSRAGYAYCGMQKQGAPNAGGTATSNPPRIIDFQYSIDQGFTLEFGDQYMRIASDGAYVIEAAQNVTAITQADPGVITIAAHGYSNGDWVFASSIGGMTGFNGLTWIVQNVTTNTFTLTDLFGAVVNTISYPAFTSGGTFARVYTVVSPYAAEDLSYLKFVQDENLMNLVCWNQKTNAAYPPYTLTRNGNTNWTFSSVSFVAAITPPTVVNSVATNSTTEDTWYSYVVTAVDKLGNESIASTSTDVFNNDISINAGSNTITWSAVDAATQYNIYAATPVYTTGGDPGFVGVQYGLIGAAFGLQFIDTNIIPDFTTSPPIHNDPFAPGTIENVTVTNSGSGLVQATTQYSITTSTGSGFAGQPIVQNGNLTGFIIDYGGIDYANTDTMQIITGGVAATGTYTFTGNPTNGQTIILNGVTWTFETLPTAAAQTKIGTNLAATLTQLASDLATSQNNSLTVAVYSITTGTVLNITYGNLGTVGNSYTLAAGSYGGTISGATLSGGSNGTASGATVSLTIGPQTGTYPGAVQYYQQRLVYADTINSPDTYYMSQPGLYSNFDYSIPTVDSDSITGTPWGVQVNGIQFMVPSIQGLLAFLGNGVWLISGGNSLAITPSDQNAQAQSQIGCSAIVPPLYIGVHVLYVQAKNSIVRDIAFNFLTNVFQGEDITVFSNHLFLGYTLSQWAYAEEPYKVIWAVRNDGALLSLTYIKEQQVQGWARHDTNGQFVSVCSVVEPPVDAVYVSVKRYIAGRGVWVYYLERADNRQWDNVEECFCVDAGLSWPMTYPAATLTPSAATGTNNITSADVINGGVGYTAPTIVAVDSTGQGSGATFGYTLVGGVITAITPTADGTNYTAGATQIVITDATGSGAIAQPIITNYVTFTASSSVFNAGMIGNVIRVDGGKATIVSQTGTACVANVTQTLTNTVPNDPNFLPVPAVSGSWSVSVPTTVVAGLNHLEGMTVSILADGGVMPQQVVTNGSITLQTAASQITIGLPFTVQWQSMYLDTPSQTTVQGKRKNISSVIVRVEASRGFTTGSNQLDASTQPNGATVPWANMSEVKERNATIAAGSAIPLFTGDIDPQYITSAWGETNGQVAIQTVNPLPLNILAVIPRYSQGDKDG